ncbi:MAG: ribosome recycling factor [Bacteroidetes bacterium]|jgi:ribosome recycling factor|nr:ribosome recycling factor [Bacteroidota bacterium]
MLDEELQLILDTAEEGMDKAVEHLRTELQSIRAGRAQPSMIENVKVDYYGSRTPITQIASVSAPQPDLLIVQPWDQGALEPIEKGIMEANMGLNPSNDGAIIRVPIPPLSEERRKELAKTARTRGEDAKIAIRNIRRSAKDELKSAQQEYNLPEDGRYRAEEKLQELTDAHTNTVDSLIDRKEKEVMEV